MGLVVDLSGDVQQVLERSALDAGLRQPQPAGKGPVDLANAPSGVGGDITAGRVLEEIGEILLADRLHGGGDRQLRQTPGSPQPSPRAR